MSRHQQRGYSLVELLVALAIVAGVTLTLAEGLRFGGRTMARADILQQEISNIVNTKRLLSEWLNNAQAHPDISGDNVFFSGDTKTLNFKTLAPAFPTTRGFYDVTLRVEPTGQGRYQLRVFRKADWVDEQPFNSILIDDASEIAFSYLDQTGWLDDWIEKKNPPSYVRVEIGDHPPLLFSIDPRIASVCLSSRIDNQFEVDSACQ